MGEVTTTVRLAGGATLRTALPADEWAARIRSGARSAWVPLEDGRTVLVRLRNVVSVEPSAGWERRTALAGEAEPGGEVLAPDSPI
jgi:hypothetical protein